MVLGFWIWRFSGTWILNRQTNGSCTGSNWMLHRQATGSCMAVASCSNHSDSPSISISPVAQFCLALNAVKFVCADSYGSNTSSSFQLSSWNKTAAAAAALAAATAVPVLVGFRVIYLCLEQPCTEAWKTGNAWMPLVNA